MQPDPSRELLLRQAAIDREGSRKSWVPRFSIARLFGTMTAICVGSGLLVLMFNNTTHTEVHPAANPALLIFSGFGGSSLIGTGVLTPFDRPILGAVIGFLIPLAILLLAFCYLLMHPVIC
jgi:hypothetical protein